MLLMCCGFCVEASSQTPAKDGVKKKLPAGMRYEGVQNRNYYIGGNNIAGMRCDNVNISTASIGGSYTEGENRKGPEAPKGWEAGVKASTIMHLKKFSMFGSFSFQQNMGYGMFTSMMINPGRYPVDILEFTAGNKTKQTYALTGGVSVDVAPQWRVGARLDFTAANYAKLKDLRYTNFGLDLNFRPGVQWLGPQGLTVGLAASVVRNSETIVAEQVGESNTSYYAFLSKGAWFGTRQVWTGGGLHLSEAGINGFPVAEMGGGASAQISYKGLYAEFAYVRTNGRVGEKDAIWFTFPVDKYDATLAWRMRGDDGTIHTVRADASFKNTVLDESVIDKVTSGGVTIRHNYGSNTIQRKQNYTFMPSWTGVKAGKYSARVHLLYAREDVTATIQYPRVDAYQLNILNTRATLTWFLPMGWSIDGALWAGMGFYNEQNTLAASNVECTTELYRSMRDYENWKFQATNPYFGVNFAPRYTFPLNIYLSAYAGCEWKPSSLKTKQYRVTTGLTLGYTF